MTIDSIKDSDLIDNASVLRHNSKPLAVPQKRAEMPTYVLVILKYSPVYLIEIK